MADNDFARAEDFQQRVDALHIGIHTLLQFWGFSPDLEFMLIAAPPSGPAHFISGCMELDRAAAFVQAGAAGEHVAAENTKDLLAKIAKGDVRG